MGYFANWLEYQWLHKWLYENLNQGKLLSHENIRPVLSLLERSYLSGPLQTYPTKLYLKAIQNCVKQ